MAQIIEQINKIYERKQKIPKARKRIIVLASILLAIILLAELPPVKATYQIDSFTADKYSVDVNETVEFSWEVTGQYTWAFINFGDGNITWYDGSETSATHKYRSEGLYTVMLTVKNITWEDTSILTGGPYDGKIRVKNEPPVFDFGFSDNSPYEDDLVTISITSLTESVVDENNLTYIYDFATGEQETTTENSTTYSWTNAGEYPVSITAIDDQGALDQKTKFISVQNKKPTAAFTLGADIPATYSFARDPLNEVPLGWSDSEPASNLAIKVVEGKDHHQKILQITGNPGYNPPGIYRAFSSQNYGTVEYYFWSENVNEELGYLSLQSGSTDAIMIYPEDGKWICYADSTETEIDGVDAPQNTTWTHVRIDFLCSGDYFELNPHQFRVIIDGKISPYYQFSSSISSVDRVEVGSLSQATDKAYLDSIGLSWDKNYEIGQNYNYFISQYYGTYDWRFDVIGTHPKEWVVEDNDPLITGEYYGTYSFEGGDLSGWISSETEWPCTVSVLDIAGHDDAMQLYDPHGSKHAIVYNSFTPQTSGNVEFWWYQNPGEGGMVMLDSSVLYQYPVFLFSDNNYYWYYGPGYTPIPLVPYNHWTWYHHRIDFDCTTDTFDWWIDGELVGNDLSFLYSKNDVQTLRFETLDDAGASRHFKSAFDAVGYSWDPDYNIGDNYRSPNHVTVVDEGGEYKQVVQLTDRSSTGNVKMEDDIEDVESGTVQFYVKSSDTDSKTWALELWNESSVELAIVMDDSWQYSVDAGFYPMGSLDTPQDNTWYPVTVEFNKQTGKFKVTVNEDEYEGDLNGAFDKITKVSFESTDNSEGVAWIDALGYSWDPGYNVDDFQYSVISYPEKTNVQFSAADSSDSDSDAESLRYYWQFGDGTTGYGKYVSHEYKTSGRYNSSLAVKDDNGEIDIYSHLVLIHNTDPTIDIDVEAENQTIIINEGETLTINSFSSDEIIDWAELMYYYDFNGTAFTLDEASYEAGGWRNSHLYTDDYSGSVGVMVKDLEGAADSDYTNIIVQNVDPLLSIYDASIEANISFEVYRNSPSMEANFTLELWTNDHIKLTEFMTFEGSSDNSIYSPNKTYVDLTLSKNWKVIANSTSELPSGSWFRVYVKLEFLDGQELITSEKLYEGEYGYWKVDLNPYWFDNGDYTFKFPITLKAQIWDPSVDNVSLTVGYNTYVLLEINCTDSLPLQDSFIKEFSFGNVSYVINIYEQSSKIYANITATQLSVHSEEFTDNSFPVDLEVEFTLNPIIDLFDLLEVEMGLTQLSIIQCFEANNYLIGNVTDDDLGFFSLPITFNTEVGIEFENLSPKISAFIPNNASTNNDINFNVQISDFDQSSNVDQNYITSFKERDVPDSFNMINGTIEGDYDDLLYQDNSYVSMTADNTRSPLSDDFTMDMGTLDSYGDLRFIDGNYTEFDSENDDGDYHGTFSFENDENGEVPNGWTDAGIGSSSSVVSGSVGGHDKVLHAQDGGSSNYYFIYNDFDNQVSGFVEFYVRTSDAGALQYIILGDAAGPGVLLAIYQGKFQVYWGGIWRPYYDCPVSSNTWYRVGISFSCTSDIFTFSYNGVPKHTDWFNTYKTNFNRLRFSSNPSLVENDNFYFDAVGFTWDEDYTTGDHLKERDYLNATSEIEFTAPEGAEEISLDYSYKSSSTPINMSVWNYNQNQWDIIEENSVYSSFTEHSYILDSSYYGPGSPVRVNFFGRENYDSFTFDLEMLKVNPGINLLNFTATFQMEGITESEIIKYLKVFYALKSTTSQTVNFSLYNFDRNTWDFVVSKLVSTTLVKDKISILSSEYINNTRDILLKVETATNTSFYLSVDQLILEYYSSAVSESNYFEHEVVAGDLYVQLGQVNEYGDLRFQDDDVINITTIEYSGSYHYPGTYSFEDDEVGSDPAGWTTSENGGSVSVILEKGAHAQVVTLNDTGTSVQNVALGGTASASSCITGYPIHQIHHLNDGNYGNSYSWIAADNDAWAMIELPESQWITRVVFGRDNPGGGSDRSPGNVDVYYSTDGSTFYSASDQVKLIQGTQNTYTGTLSAGQNAEYTFTPFLAKYIKLYKVNNGGCIDELEIYGAPVTASIEQTPGGVANGTVELHMRSTDASGPSMVNLGTDGSELASVFIWNDKFYVSSSDGDGFLRSASDDTWYNVRVDFEQTTGGYMGLSQYEAEVYIDSVSYGSYTTKSTDSLSDVSIGIAGSGSGFETYYDAIGYSWDENYEVGMNKNPEIPTFSLSSQLYQNGIQPNDAIDFSTLYYSFKTNISTHMNIFLYNFTSQQWNMIESGSHTEFFNGSYIIKSEDYYNAYFDVKVKFEANDSLVFDFSLDQLTLKYSWYKSSEEYLYKKCPTMSSDFTLYNGTIASWGGTLDFVDGNYPTFTSSNGIMNFTSQVKMDALKLGDVLDSLTLLYSYKTNLSQIITLSLYNYSSSEWVTYDQGAYTIFNNKSSALPIVRNEEVGNETVSYYDFYNSNNTLLIKIAGFNASSEFELYLDQLMIQYEFTPYYFLSNTSRMFDVVEGDYVNFDSTDHYPGTFSFENDKEGTIPLGWIDAGSAASSSVIMNTFDGRNKVLHSQDGGGSNTYEIYTDFDNQVSGVIEFWVRTSDPNALQYILVEDESGAGVLLAIYQGKFQVFWGSIWRPYGNCPVSANTWYRAVISFSCTSDQFTFYQYNSDNILIGAHTDWFNVFKTNLNRLRFIGHEGYVENDDFYLDAVGFSWDTNYTGGDNRYKVAVVDEYIPLELKAMTSHRLDLLESLEVDYSIQTSITQQMSINLYNFVDNTWDEFESLTTNNSQFFNGTLIIEGTDYINDNFEVEVKFFGINDTVEDFEFHLKKLQVSYEWSKALIDFGHNGATKALSFNVNLSSPYQYWYEEEFAFEYQGQYLVTTSADDGYATSKTGEVLEIINPDPFAKIANFPEEVYEDEIVKFSSNIFSYGTFANETRYMWSWGDGYYSYEKETSHAWSEAGVYNISLFAKDCFGNTHTDLRTITILEKAPEIIGPLAFYGVEGQAIILDVEIYDSHIDEFSLQYRWYNETNDLIAAYEKPSIIRDDGEYMYRLEVEDSEGKTAKAYVKIIVENLAPMVLVSNYMYYGAPGGLLDFTAYAFDTFYDMSDMDFYWNITNGEDSIYEFGTGMDTSCTIDDFELYNTSVYMGEVLVEDPSGATGVASFTVTAFIDSNSDGISDEFMARLLETNENLTTYTDSDEDYLTDLFEIGISNTSHLNYDTDGDGLWDGRNNETNLGELTLGTDPRDWDTDNDWISDGFEYFGWNITTEYLGTVHVNSNPCDEDTDDDGMDDYEEYMAGTHPRMEDTDNDGLQDGMDPHPLKWDGDEDGLSDYKEWLIGTDPNATDTDQDGLTDGEEVLGLVLPDITDPLSADTDHDFLSDSAEIMTYKYEIPTKKEMDEPVTLMVERHCEAPIAAQLAFSFTFGEYVNNETMELEYGVETVPDLQVYIMKEEENIVLFNITTNGTAQRYVSHVVDLMDAINKLNASGAEIDPEKFDYYGYYTIIVNGTDLDCLLEQFEIEIAKHLNATNPDTDGDGILDGVEVQGLVAGDYAIDFTDSYWTEFAEAISAPFEVGQVVLTNTIDKGYSAPIFFVNSYNNPVVVAYIMTRADGQSVEVRVTDITSDNCTIFMEEPDNSYFIPLQPSAFTLYEGSSDWAGDLNFIDGSYTLFFDGANYYVNVPVQPTDFTLYNGTSDWAGDLNSIDGSYTTFFDGTNYFVFIPVQPTDFIIYDGSSDWAGDLNSIDGNYTTFNSELTSMLYNSMPAQPNDFTFTKGSLPTIGDLEFIDSNKTVIASEYIPGGEYQDTFGYTSAGATNYQLNPDNKQGSKFTLTRNGNVSKISAYAKLGGGAKNPKEAKACIYSDSSGSPDSLLYESSATTLTSTLQWYDFTFSPTVELNASTYWLVLHHGTKIQVYGDTGDTNQRSYNADDYSDGAEQQFGTPTQDDVKLSIYATYNYTSSGSNELSSELEWTISDNVGSIEYLSWNYSSTASITYSIYNYTKGDYDDHSLTTSPLALTSDYYSGATLKVKFEGTDSSSFTVDIDQLRVEYSKGVSKNSMPAQFADFTFTKGDFTSSGDLEFIDSNNAVLSPEYVSGGLSQGTFGYTTAGSTNYQLNPDNKQGSKFTLAHDGNITQISVYAKLGGGAKNPKEAKACIYSDSSGSPGSLLFESTPTTLTSTLQWYNFTFSSTVSLNASTYWLVLHHGTKIQVYGDTGDTNQRSYNADDYSDGAEQQFGTPTQDDVKLSIYATYDYSSSGTYEIISEVEWTTDGDVTSMDYLAWNYTSSATTSFYVYDYGTQSYDDHTPTNSPLTLTSEYYNGTTVKVKFESTDGSNYSFNIDQLRVEYTTPQKDEKIDVDVNIQLDSSVATIDGLNLYYSYKTNITQAVDLLIWNYDLNQWDIIDNSNYDSFNEYSFELNSSYYDASYDMLLKFNASNNGLEYELQLEELKVYFENHILDFESKIHLDSEVVNSNDAKLYYSYKTNTTQPVDLKIWNYDLTKWDIIDTSNYDTFTEQSFAIDSSYYDANYDMLIKVNGTNYDMNGDYELQLEELNVYFEKNQLDFEAEISLDSSVESSSDVKLYYSYKTNTTQPVDLLIWNYDLIKWDTIDTSNYDSFSEQYFTITNAYYDGNYDVLIRVNGTNYNVGDDFDLQLEELKIYVENLGHSSETVGYIIMEAGAWELPDGLKVEAGTITTGSNHTNGDTFGGDTVYFTQAFVSTPVVLHSLNTYNNGDFKTSIAHSVTKNNFTVQQECGRDKSTTSVETIGWIAVKAAMTGTINGVRYETDWNYDGTADGVGDPDSHTITYTPSWLRSTPIVVISQMSANDPSKQGSYARSDGTHTSATHEVYAEEDRDDKSSSRSHPDETFGYWAFESSVTATGQQLKNTTGVLLTTDNDASTYDEFYLEIPYIGKVNNANLTLNIESVKIPLGIGATIGTINVKIIKEEINCSLSDPELIDLTFDIYDGCDFSEQIYVDLSAYLANGTISEYYGTYCLEITITNSSMFDLYDFTLTEYYIQTDTWIVADGLDIASGRGWYSDPALADSDMDGWDDYREIFTEGTNPLSVDTDGDGAWDPNDMDPLRDIIIEIEFRYGEHNNLYEGADTPYMLGCVEFEVYNNYYCYYTEIEKATANVHNDDDDLYTKAYFEHFYYFNVPDDKKIQSNEIVFDIELWQMQPRDDEGHHYADIELVDGTEHYSIMNGAQLGYEECEETDGPEEGNDNKIRFNLKTIALEKANTIAIYEQNITFNGHYPDVTTERYNIIQLWVTDNNASTPFVQGANAIIITTSLFADTKLNGLLMQERLAETPLYAVGDEFQMISANRDEGAESDGSSSHVDFVIIRQEISSGDAMKVLDLLLTCIVNETLDETNQTVPTEAVLYTYISTKINGTKATHMSLPSDVIKYVPWNKEDEYGNPYINSPQSAITPSDEDDLGENVRQETSSDAYAGFVGGSQYPEITLEALGELLELFGFVGDVIAMVVAVIIELTMFLLSFLEPLLWLILRAILLILIFIMIAVYVLVTCTTYLTLGTSLFILSALLGGDCSFSWNFVEFSFGDSEVRMESEIEWEYSSYWAMDFPWAVEIMKSDGEVLTESKSFILGGKPEKSEYKYEDTEDTGDYSPFPEGRQSPPKLHCNYRQIDDSTYDFSTTYQDDEGNAPATNYGVKLHLIAPNGSALQYYNLTIHPDFAGDPDYAEGVKFNYTIDLCELYSDGGLWHFYFTTKDDSSIVQKYPEEGYLLGPLTCLNIPAIYYSRITCDSDNDFIAGFKNETFTFKVGWLCDIIPESVKLCLIPATITEGVNVSNTVGVKKFTMNTVEQSPNFSKLVEYDCTVNFDDLGYQDSELGWFYHYFEAEFSDGNKSYLHDTSANQSADAYLFDTIDVDLKGPYVVTEGPQLLVYTFYDANDIMDALFDNSKGKDTYLVVSEMEFVFEVVYDDPYGGEPLDDYPRLIFENVITSEESEPFTMTERKTSLSEEYGAKSYVCKVKGSDLASGMWRAKFEAKDKYGISASCLTGTEKFWVIGSGLDMFYGFSSTVQTAGIIPLIGFTTSIGFITAEPKIAMVIAIGMLIMGLASSIMSIVDYYSSDNTGGLLGFSVAMLFSFFSILHVLSFDDEGLPGAVLQGLLPNKKFLTYLGFIQIIWFAFMASLYNFRSDDPTYDIILSVTSFITMGIEIIVMFTASAISGIIYGIQQRVAEQSPASLVVEKSMQIYAYALMVISIIGFALFAEKTQAYGVFE